MSNQKVERFRMSSLFDFDQELVEMAMGDDEEAFGLVVKHLYVKLDQIERKIEQLCPNWPMEHRERILDLFVHDRFLKLFKKPQKKEKIEDINLLCWTMLWSSIADAYRFYRAGMRDVRIECHGDEDGFGEDGLSTFWESHATEILLSPCQWNMSASARTELSDLMQRVDGYLRRMGGKKRRVVYLWAVGFSEREIAETLNMTVGNVGSIVSRAISELRKKLCKNMA